MDYNKTVNTLKIHWVKETLESESWKPQPILSKMDNRSHTPRQTLKMLFIFESQEHWESIEIFHTERKIICKVKIGSNWHGTSDPEHQIRDNGIMLWGNSRNKFWTRNSMSNQDGIYLLVWNMSADIEEFREHITYTPLKEIPK